MILEIKISMPNEQTENLLQNCIISLANYLRQTVIKFCIHTVFGIMEP